MAAILVMWPSQGGSRWSMAPVFLVASEQPFHDNILYLYREMNLKDTVEAIYA